MMFNSSKVEACIHFCIYVYDLKGFGFFTLLQTLFLLNIAEFYKFTVLRFVKLV